MFRLLLPIPHRWINPHLQRDRRSYGYRDILNGRETDMYGERGTGSRPSRVKCGYRDNGREQIEDGAG